MAKKDPKPKVISKKSQKGISLEEFDEKLKTLLKIPPKKDDKK